MTAEWHVVYRRELKLDDPVRVTLQLVDFDDKRLHVFMTMKHSRSGDVLATAEQMLLHVDSAAGKAAPAPADVLAKLKPAFERPWGKVTAGNSSGITDAVATRPGGSRTSASGPTSIAATTAWFP